MSLVRPSNLEFGSLILSYHNYFTHHLKMILKILVVDYYLTVILINYLFCNTQFIVIIYITRVFLYYKIQVSIS